MKNLSLSIVLILLSCWSITATCQPKTITDSCTCVPNSDLKKGAYWIERGAMNEQLLAEANTKIDFLNQRINDLQKIVAEYENIVETINPAIVKSYETEIANLTKQRDIAKEAAKKIDKLLRRQKRKTVLVIAGTAIVVIGVYTLIK